MKIASISPVFYPYRGGIGVVCAHNASSLAVGGHAVEILTPRYKSNKIVAEKLESFGPGLVRRLKPFFSYGNAAVLPQLAWQLKKYDAVHLHYPFIGATASVIAAKLLFKKKLVVTYHMDLFGRGGIRQPIFQYYNRYLVPLLMRLADRVIVTSRDYGEASRIGTIMEKYPEKFYEVPNSVDTTIFAPTEKSQDLLNRHGIDGKEKVILFVGGLDTPHYFKGIEYLIDAFDLILHNAKETGSDAPYKLLVVGDGDLKSNYEEKAASLGLSDKIIFPGSVTDVELPQYYNLADIVVLPSTDSSEAFGVMLVEGMACGKPVVASQLPGVRSVVREGENGYLTKPCNVADLATKLLAILTDEQKAQTMGAKARAIAEKHYSHEAMGELLKKVFTW